MNWFEKFVSENRDGPYIDKYQNYFEIYHRHFERFRDAEVHIVEFGVSQGGSLRMWKQYFGSQCRVYGVDINPHCRKFEEEGVEIYIGSQTDRKFLRRLARDIPRIDIVVDNGGHTMRQQKTTFQEIFPHVSENGVYLCEDTHTSYWLPWRGGYRFPNTFVEFSKKLIDHIHAWHVSPATSQFPRLFYPLAFFLRVSGYTRTIHSLHYYDSVLVVEKGNMQAAARRASGRKTIPDYRMPGASLYDSLKKLLSRKEK